MDLQKLKSIVMGWVQEHFQRNYDSGVPKIPPHRHDGIDNLKIKSTDLSGNTVTKIIAGTSITVSPTSGVGDVTVSSSGGGGGSPGGNVKDVQFNNPAGTFDGVDTFTFDATGDQFSGPLLKVLDDVSAFSGTVSTNVVCASDADPYMEVNNNNPLLSRSDYSTLIMDGFNHDVKLLGANAPNTSTVATPILIQGGLGADSASTPKNGATVQVFGGDSSRVASGIGKGGDVVVAPGVVINVSPIARNNTIFLLGGAVMPCADLNTPTNLNNLRSTTFGPLIVMQNLGAGASSTNPPSTISGAGILYVDAGALKYVGSSGTVSTIAPA